jgi:hypothetical protein
MTLHHIAFYLYARHFAPGGVPPVAALVGFSMLNSAIANIGVVAAVTLQFDYVAASHMGTISAGIGITPEMADACGGHAKALLHGRGYFTASRHSAILCHRGPVTRIPEINGIARRRFTEGWLRD